MRFASAKVQGRSGTTPVIGIDTGAATRLYKAEWKEGSPATFDQLGSDGVVVDANSGVGKGRKVGDRLVLTTPTGEQVTYVIRGLLDAGDFSLLGGGIVVPNDRLTRDTLPERGEPDAGRVQGRPERPAGPAADPDLRAARPLRARLPLRDREHAGALDV